MTNTDNVEPERHALPLKAVVRYDGGGFSGWQVQPERRTVQGTIEDALARIAGQRVHIHGAGRTDAGVHALGQVFSFAWPSGMPPATLRHALCRMLGPEIRIESIEQVAPEFHARKSARAKRYAYCLDLARPPDPFSARYAWSVPPDLDMMRVETLAQRVVGLRDFAGFQGGKSAVEDTVRRVYSVSVHRGGVIGPSDTGTVWRIEFHGDGFLYKMVRNITGTLVEIARGALPERRLDELLDAPAPFHGFTAPGRGLFLLEVIYTTSIASP